jgi:hypothetical protein
MISLLELFHGARASSPGIHGLIIREVDVYRAQKTSGTRLAVKQASSQNELLENG